LPERRIRPTIHACDGHRGFVLATDRAIRFPGKLFGSVCTFCEETQSRAGTVSELPTLRPRRKLVFLTTGLASLFFSITI
jgi:hypothetical protein